MKIKKKYTTQFKSKVKLEVLKEEKTFSQISSEYKVPPIQLSRWKNIALENFDRLFDDSNKSIQELNQIYQKREDELYKEIGKLSVQVD